MAANFGSKIVHDSIENFNKNSNFFNKKNVFENVLCEMVAILSRGETS